MVNLINNIIIHCSDSRFGNANTIREWHKEKGWRDIGYHFVILNGHITPNFYLRSLDGAIECGRFLDGNKYLDWQEIGAHALGYNRNSIGICLIGKDEFTGYQFANLYALCQDLMDKFNIVPKDILGHCETEKGKRKTCPNIDMADLRQQMSALM